MKKLTIILLSLALAASITGCASTGRTTATTAATKASAAATTTAAGSATTAAASGAATTQAATAATTTAADTATTQKVFTLDELKTYDGQNGNPAYVAVNGVVYDVTKAKGWSNGAHQGNTAGQDLTSVIASAPHGTSILSGLTIVGTLA